MPAELLNNIAALYHKRGFLAQAKKFYVKALKEFGVAAPSTEGALKVPYVYIYIYGDVSDAVMVYDAVMA